MTQVKTSGGNKMMKRTTALWVKMKQGVTSAAKDDHGQRGSAMVIALMVMLLLMGFVALAISRTNSETIASANDEAETKAVMRDNVLEFLGIAA